MLSLLVSCIYILFIEAKINQYEHSDVMIIYNFVMALADIIRSYNELFGEREEKTSSSEMEATYSLRCWQR